MLFTSKITLQIRAGTAVQKVILCSQKPDGNLY